MEAPIQIRAVVATLDVIVQTQTKISREGHDMILPIALTAAGLAAIINIWLAIRCGQVRTSQKISIGDGGNDALIRRMRAHSNFVEFTPFVLILIALIEYSQGTSTWLWVVMGVYMLGRVAHGVGMDGGEGIMAKGREVGIILTMLILIGLGGYAIAIPHISGPDIVEVDATGVPAN
jgi:uncharacterized protein